MSDKKRKMTIGEYVDLLNKRESKALDERQESLAAMLADISRALREHVMETRAEARERFESWRIMQCDDSVNLARDLDGEYLDGMTRLMWRTWQASQHWRADDEDPR